MQYLNWIAMHQFQKELYVQVNAPDMNKQLRKSIMQRSRLEHIYTKKQQNYCLNKLKMTKTIYYNNLNMNNLTDKTEFWGEYKTL